MPKKNTPDSFIMERKGRRDSLDRGFDIAYWQSQGPEAIFEEAWRMVLNAHGVSAENQDSFRMDRTAETIRRRGDRS